MNRQAKKMPRTIKTVAHGDYNCRECGQLIKKGKKFMHTIGDLFPTCLECHAVEEQLKAQILLKQLELK